MVFWELDKRCLDRVAAEQKEENTEEALGRTIVPRLPVEEQC